MLNNRNYVLGIHYLTSNSVRKVRLNLLGTILEDVIDTILDDGKVKRISGKNVMIISGDKIVRAYKNFTFP